MQTPCKHENAEIIARQEGVDYVRCQDCGRVFEAEDLELPAGREDDEEASQVA